MPDLSILNSLRFYELGPILERMNDGSRLGLVNTETEVKNIYRVLRVLRPLIELLALRGDVTGLIDVSLDSAGAGTSLIFDNTLPDFFLRSLIEGDNITITVSADGKEITIASTGGVGTHELSDGDTHTDVAGSATPSEVNTNEEDGAFLTWDDTTSPTVHQRWELSRIGNAGSDDVTGPDYSIGVFHAFEPNILNFGAGAVIGGRHTMRDIAAVNGSFITLALSGSDIQIAFDKTNFNLDDVADVFYTSTPAQFDILQQDAAGKWTNFSHFLVLTSTSNSTASFMRLRRERASSAAVQSGDILFKADYEGWDGLFWGDGAQLVVTATENFSVGNHGTKMEFFTVDNGSSTLDLRMTIDQDGTVTVAQGLVADTFAATTTLTGTELISTVATGTAPLTVSSTTEVANLNTDTMDAGGTARDWDGVQYTKQRPLSFVDFVTAGTDAATWLTGAIGHVLTKVATGTPPAESVIYAGQIPTGYSATPVLKWRFYNGTVQTGGDQKAVLWRVQYNSPGSSGTISAVDTGTPTTTLDTDQAVNTIKEESLALSNIAAGDLFNVTISVDSAAGTTLVGDVVLLGVPWLEFTQAGLPDTGSAS